MQRVDDFGIKEPFMNLGGILGLWLARNHPNEARLLGKLFLIALAITPVVFVLIVILTAD
jgi:ABC-type molybdate transport system permease subunit